MCYLVTSSCQVFLDIYFQLLTLFIYNSAIVFCCILNNQYAEEMSNFHDPMLPSCTDGLLAFQSVSDLDSIPNFWDYDIDEQLPTSIQSQYYSVLELASLETKSQDLSILHTNVRSLSCHHDDLIFLLGASNKSFDVIGVSEIWHSEKHPIITNVDIDGYTFYSTKSFSQNGGVGLYVKSSINCPKRFDLN